MPLRPRGAQALTSGCLGSRTARNSGSLSRLGAVACAYHEPLIRLQEKDDCLGLALSLLAGLSVPRSSTCGSQPCQSLYRPPLHWPVRPSLVHLSTGLSVPLSSTSLQACRSLSRPPLHRPVSPSLVHLPLHMSVSPCLVHLSTGLSVPLSSTSPQTCQSLSRPPLHRPDSPSLVHLFTGLSVPLSTTYLSTDLSVPCSSTSPHLSTPDAPVTAYESGLSCWRLLITTFSLLSGFSLY